MAELNKPNSDSLTIESRPQENERTTNSSWSSVFKWFRKKNEGKDEYVEDETVEDETVEDETVEDETVEDETVEDESVKDDSTFLERLNRDLTLRKYQDFLERLAWNKEVTTFCNGGIYHASILMSVLFQNTHSIARVYAIGFRPDLITLSPYWESLNRYLDDPNHVLKVLVEKDDFVNDPPIKLLRKKKEEREQLGKGDTIIVKKINKECQKRISEVFGDEHCNFSIFDKEKYRYEYDPNNFKAYGSFNQPDNCEILTREFENAFANATLIF